MHFTDFIIDRETDLCVDDVHPLNSQHLLDELLRETSVVNRIEERCGLSLVVIDPISLRFMSGIPREINCPVSSQLIHQLHAEPTAVVEAEIPGVWQYGIRIPGTEAMVGGLLLNPSSGAPPAWMAIAAKRGVSPTLWKGWVERHSSIRPDLLAKLLRAIYQTILEETVAFDTGVQAKSSSAHLQTAFEVLVTIREMTHEIAQNISPVIYAEQVIQRMNLICPSECSAACLPDQEAGCCQVQGPWGCHQADIIHLIESLLDGDTPHVLVCNHIQHLQIRRLFPRIHSIVAAPVHLDDGEIGWLILANPIRQTEFGTEEANLLRYFASLVTSRYQHLKLQHRRDEMVLGFIRSLVSAIDAKDPYTRGHSERVALVSREIAVALELPLGQVAEIYESAMLHDIGKIGVDDAVIRKPGKLEEAEFRDMARHPDVGFRILSELTTLKHVLPGVRHHHERFDGRGYPSQLLGHEIPLMAKVIAVADSFDAMCSDRPYRKGMDREVVEGILTKGAGTQWDPAIIDAFMRSRGAIYRVWDASWKSNCQPLTPTMDILAASSRNHPD